MPVSERTSSRKSPATSRESPGTAERESRRETDRRVREFLAGRASTRGRAGPERPLSNQATDAGQLKALDAIRKLDRILQKSVSSLRYADYGFSGLFDQMKIREAELDQVYAYDAALRHGRGRALRRSARAVAQSPQLATLAALAGTAEQARPADRASPRDLRKPTA